jgi:hypothetical protein
MMKLVKLVTTILLAALPLLTCAAADVSVSMKTRSERKGAEKQIQKFYNDVTFHNHTGNSQQYAVILFALEKRGATYVCQVRIQGQITVPKRAKVQTQYGENREFSRIKWTWLLLVMQDDKLVAHCWSAGAMRMDPELFVDLDVGDVAEEDPK